MRSLKSTYGKLALIAGGSEGIGAAFAAYLAKAGLDLILVARNEEKLVKLAKTLKEKYSVSIDCISCDLAQPTAPKEIWQQLGHRPIDVLVYNAALSYIGPFEDHALEHHLEIAQANMLSPLEMLHRFGTPMLKRGRGACILMASLAGFQGSGFLSSYAATKAFDRILAESLWYEWKDRGVDVMACCAGATSSPNFIKSNPEKSSPLAPRIQKPEEVVAECFQKLGTKPSIICGRGNRWASFVMQRLMPRKMAIQIMGDTTRKLYRIPK